MSPVSTPSTPHPGRLLLLRHGTTEWSATGRHTGSTDVPLTGAGEEQARAAGPLLRHLLGGSAPVAVLSSPRQRALRTAELAGLEVTSVDGDLAEWDYGAYEGLTTPQIREQRGDDWRVFRDGVAPGGPGQPPGEQLADVAARAGRAVERVRPLLEEGDVVVVAHGHLLRVLAAVWLEADPAAGAQLLLDTAAACVLDVEHGVPGVRRWNLTPDLLRG